MNDSQVREGFETRCQKVLQVARELHARRPDWVTFFRETLGVSGAARSVFPEQDDYVQFEQSAEFAEIQQLVASLRTTKPGSGKNEATKVITVRLPESLHESLKAEAADHSTSMNKLCISKLLQALVDEEDDQPAAPQPPTRSQQPPTPATHAPTVAQPAPPTQPTATNPPTAWRQPSAPQQPPSSGFRSTYGQ